MAKVNPSRNKLPRCKAEIILICGTTLALLCLWIFPQFYFPLWKKITF